MTKEIPDYKLSTVDYYRRERLKKMSHDDLIKYHNHRRNVGACVCLFFLLALLITIGVTAYEIIQQAERTNADFGRIGNAYCEARSAGSYFQSTKKTSAGLLKIECAYGTFTHYMR